MESASRDSTPSSYHTAPEMSSSSLSDVSTPTEVLPHSSQSVPSPFSSSTRRSRSPRPRYRASRNLPYELREQVAIYFEEGLYIQALNLLTSVLASGATSNQAAFIPPPTHLAFISTLSLHPKWTTRAKLPEKLHAANTALAYLNALHRNVGSSGSRITEAYAFADNGFGRRVSGSSNRRRGVSEDTGSPENDRGEGIHSELAEKESLFARADDFWKAVGWALNCSVLHPKRWERWCLWLEYMLDVLEDDWAEREAEDGEISQEARRGSLIAKYIEVQGGEKRIVRAIFADGSVKSRGEFTEVWKNETLERKENQESFRRPLQKVNIEEGEYGDYMLSSDEEELASNEEGTAPDVNAAMKPETKLTSFPSGAAALGGTTALSLRMRLLALLSALSTSLPDAFCNLTQLYDIYLTHMRPLFLPTFLAILAPQALSAFPPDAASSMVQYITRSLLEPVAPTPTMDELNWDIIANYYAPWAAAGQGNRGVVGENGKVAICVESLVGMMRREVGLGAFGGMSEDWEDDKKALWAKVEEGCQRREERAKSGGRKKRKGEAGAEASYEVERALELAYLSGARTRMAVALCVKL